jgi:hypothetical protein
VRPLTVLGFALASLAPGAPAAGQAVAARSSGRCTFQIDHVGGLGSQFIVGADTNWFGGGGVRLSCAGTSVRMSSDSVASFGRDGRIEFIGSVKYRDSTLTMDAKHGTYYKNGERWEARGDVVTTNLENGSTLTGPALDYYRVLPGVRDTLEMYAVGRPTIRTVPLDSAGNRAEPYVIVADRVRMKGNDRTWAGGTVTIDRSDFSAHADSMMLDNGPGQKGTLIGHPEMRGLGADSFEVRGRRIDLTLDHQEITYVTAVDSAHAVSAQVDLVADTIGLDVDHRHLVQTLAWGPHIRPQALTPAYEVRGDSLAFDTPGQLLREVRAFRHAWVGTRVDSVGAERDWLSGDTVVADFTRYDSAGTTRSALERLTADGSARSFYRVKDRQSAAGLPSINYSRGDRITVRMSATGTRGVEQVDVRGHADGVHLEPLPPGASPDSTRAAGPAVGAG